MPRHRSRISRSESSSSESRDRYKRTKHRHSKKRPSKRSPSESSSSERHHRHHKRSAKHRKVSKERSRRRTESKQPDEPVRERRKEKPKSPVIEETTVVKTGEISLSVAETNKLREKLGLTPLETDDDPADKEKSTDVHLPPKNISDVQNSEKLREKIAIAREKRLLEEKLAATKPAAEDEKLDLPTSEWLKEFEKKLSSSKSKEETQKILDQANEQFDLGNIITAEREAQLSKQYDSADLKGLRVEHAQELIKEGRPVILTLKDSEILKDEEDVLINVNIVDDIEAKRNALLRQKKFYDSQFNEETLETSLLAKYDEEIHGRKMESFVLDEEGKFDPEEEKARNLARERLQSSAVSLDIQVKPIYDYSEPKEAQPVSFRKLKKKKTHKPKILKADEILAMAEADEYKEDLGNRKLKAEMIAEIEAEMNNLPSAKEELPIDSILLEDVNDVDLKITVPSERKPKLTAELVARKLTRNRTLAPVKEEPIDSPMVIDSMSEFCRTLGDVPTITNYGTSQAPTEVPQNEIKKEDIKSEDEEEEYASNEKEATSNNYAQSSDNVILDEEPVISSGLSSAVKVAQIKGYLERQKSRQDARLGTQVISALHYTIEDRSHYDIDDKFSRKERYCGPVTAFRERSDYRPTVALEYLGDDGRKMSMKEAFRYLSHRFHGKGSGKRKTEKRMLKIKEEEAMKHMSSVDTPLHTASMLLDRQKELKQPYITLSASKKDPAQLLRKI